MARFIFKGVRRPKFGSSYSPRRIKRPSMAQEIKAGLKAGTIYRFPIQTPLGKGYMYDYKQTFAGGFGGSFESKHPRGYRGRFRNK